MARSGIKPSITEKAMACPYCWAEILVYTVKRMIPLSKRTCPVCHKDFLIERDVPKKAA